MSYTIVGGQEPGRNDPCSCGSGLKYKHCHGDNGKRNLMPCPCGSDLKFGDCHGDMKKLQAVKKLSDAFMVQLIRRERMEQGLEPFPFTCNKCGKGFVRAKESTIVPGALICPHCDSTDLTRTVPIPSNQNAVRELAVPQAETTIIEGNS